jgi:hypothetical protein
MRLSVLVALLEEIEMETLSLNRRAALGRSFGHHSGARHAPGFAALAEFTGPGHHCPSILKVEDVVQSVLRE